jgi:hypothetical protein
MRRRVGAAWAGAAVVVACGGSTSTLGGGGGSVSVSGTVDGMPLAVTDEVALVGSASSNGVTEAYAGVVITNIAGTCAVLERGGNPASAQALQIVAGAPGSTVPPGQYPIGATTTTTASASFSAQDTHCMSTAGEQATSGTVTLTAVSDSQLQGSFDLTFANGDHLAGSFTAPVCNAAILTGGNNPACGS